MSQNKVFTTLGASSHATEERQVDDYYATDPKAVDLLLEVEEFDGTIWECACGEGHVSKRLIELGHNVISTDLIDRGYGEPNVNFLTQTTMRGTHIITNPPYKHAQQFCERGLALLDNDKKMAMFLKLLFLESKKRKSFFLKYPPRTIYVSSSRIQCAKNGDFINMNPSAIAYAWFVWEKGFTGKPTIDWIN